MILIAVAVLAALFAAYLATSLQPTPVVQDQTPQPPPKPDTVEVMVAGRDVPFAGLIDDQAISWTAWPRNLVTGDMITREDTERTAKVKDGRVRVPVYQGEPLDLRYIVPAGDVSFMSAILPKGHRAVPVSISPKTASGGFILPGDRVDVML